MSFILQFLPVLRYRFAFGSIPIPVIRQYDQEEEGQT
jgi:hypothetical protein